MDLVDAMIQGMIETKLNRGFRKLSNGLYMDCIGQVYSIDLTQDHNKSEDGEISNVKIKLKPAPIAMM